MAYEIVSEIPTTMIGNNSLGLPEARNLGKAPPACPPFKACFDNYCPFFEYESRREDLCNRILGAVDLAKKAASTLKKPLQKDTIDKFRKIFGESPGDLWKLPWAPRQKMSAGDIVAQRFRTVEQELRTRETIYRCVSASRCQPGPAEPAHPTETIVRDTIAWAVLCKDEVWLCPRFWQLKREEQEGTVLHEMFHLCFGLTCAWFQHDSKERKKNSAHCYEAFALSVAGRFRRSAIDEN